MKTLLLLIFLAPTIVFGIGRQVTFSGGSPSLTSYSASDTQSRIQVCNGNTVEIYNQTSAVLAYGFGTVSGAPSGDYKFVPPGPNSGVRVQPEGGLSPQIYVYIRTPAAALTSGTVEVACTTEGN